MFNNQLYIPPPFRPDMEMQINEEWNAFTAPLFKSSALGAPERAFLLVEVKSMDRTEYGFKLQPKHMARPIFMGENIYAQIAKRSSLPLLLLPQSKKRQCSIVGLILVEGTGRGNLRVVDVSLMLVNKFFIPVGTTYELELSNTLCHANRTFTRGASRLTGADFVLRDTFPPTAMMIYSLNSPDYVRTRNAVVEQCVRDGCNIWKWDLASNVTCPTLPVTSSKSSSVQTPKVSV
jgi:hypothetical protein